MLAIVLVLPLLLSLFPVEFLRWTEETPMASLQGSYTCMFTINESYCNTTELLQSSYEAS